MNVNKYQELMDKYLYELDKHGDVVYAKWQIFNFCKKLAEIVDAYEENVEKL